MQKEYVGVKCYFILFFFLLGEKKYFINILFLGGLSRFRGG